MDRVPCVNQDICPLVDTERGCFEDVHHLYYPRREYKTGIQKSFRELAVNKVVECRWIHNTEHAVSEPPEMPDRNAMLTAINNERQRRVNGLA